MAVNVYVLFYLKVFLKYFQMTCFTFGNFSNLLLFVEQHIDQVRDGIEGPGGRGQPLTLVSSTHTHTQFESGPLGCLLLSIAAVLSRSIEK